jgi:hypothetical protein
MTRTPAAILVRNWEEGANGEREKRVTPEFGERKEEKILPPNSGRYIHAGEFLTRSPHLKRPGPLGLKCDTITSPRRLVNTFIHQMIPDLLIRDKPIKVAINFKSWSTTQDISSE